MAGGDGKRLRPLTEERAKPAVPFGGIYRIIDLTLSNCLNSGIRQILVLTQYKSDSLIRHLEQGWSFLSHEMGEFIWNMPPQKRVGDAWYQGTADSVYQNLFKIRGTRPAYIVVLSADHIYKMDYRRMLDFLIEQKADAVIATNPVSKAEAREFGVVQIDDSYAIREFREKVADPPTMPGKPDTCLANMGIYIFPADLLYDVLEEYCGRGTGYDFGKDILPALVNRGMRVCAWPFEDLNQAATPYWRDVGTLDAYYEANMDLVSVNPSFNLYDETWPIRSLRQHLAPAKFVFAGGRDDDQRRGEALDSIVSAGCIVSGGHVQASLLSPAVRVNSWARVEGSILMHEVNVGRRARIKRAIVDKKVEIPPGVEIGFDPEADRKRGFVVTESGLVVVGRRQKIPEATVQINTS